MFKVDRNLLPSHLIKSFYQNSQNAKSITIAPDHPTTIT